MGKKYNCGILVGRFEPIHIGHEMLVNIALNDCKKVVLIVTSNNILDDRNPFDIDFKVHLINKIFKIEIESENLIVVPFCDKNDIDKSYGEKILSIVKKESLCDADYIIYGDDKDINKCFNKDNVDKLHKVKINRNKINISATKIREFLSNNDYENLKKYLNPRVYEEIDLLNEKYKRIKRTFV